MGATFECPVGTSDAACGLGRGGKRLHSPITTLATWRTGPTSTALPHHSPRSALVREGMNSGNGG